MGLYFILGLAYSIVNPILESPDEVLNYQNIRFFVEERRLPVLQEGELSKGHHPPLYYALEALLTGWVSSEYLDTFVARTNPFWAYRPWEPGVDNKSLYLHDPALESWPYRDVALGVHLARWLSLLMGAGVVMIIYRIASELFPHERSLALAAAALVAFNPMFLYIQSSVHNDTLTNLWAALTLWGTVRYWLHGPSMRRAAFLGLSCGLGAITKITFLFLGPAVSLAMVWRSWLDRRTNPYWRRDLTRLALISGGLAALISGWWFVRNQLIYGDPTSMGWQAQVWSIRENAPDVKAALNELGFLHNSFWGVFGYGQIPMPAWVYALLWTLTLVAAGGLALWLVRARRRGWQYRAPAALLGALAVAPLTALAATFSRMTISATADFGRYLFTTYGVIAPALVLGVTEWQPARWRPATLSALAIAFLLLGTGALVGVLAPAYTPPPIYTSADEVEITHRLQVEYPGLAQLLGYSVTPESAVPGEVVNVTLYWHVIGTVEEDYIEFVQLIKGNDERIGSRDTHAGLGRYPTSRWQPGQIIADTIPVPIDANAQGPDGLRLDVGLHDDGRRLLTADGHDTIRAGFIRLAAQEPPTPVGAPVQYKLGEWVELIAIQPPAAQLAAGDTVHFTLTWTCVRQPEVDYVVFVHLLNHAGEIVTQFDGPPLNGTFPTRLWQPGDVVIDARPMRLPTDLPVGTYQVIAGWYLLDTWERLPVYDAAGRSMPDSAIPLFTFEVKPSPVAWIGKRCERDGF